MPQRPEECIFRAPIESNHADTAVCGLVSRTIGVADPELCLVQRDACEACCRSLRQSETINPVVASLIYNAARRISDSGGHPQCSLERASKLQRCATDHLELVLTDFPTRSFPPRQTANLDPRPAMSATHASQKPVLSWAVGLMTAPRRAPTIDKTIGSLQRAGFDAIHVFAEPGSWLPPTCHHLPITIHSRRLGALLNFYSSLDRLFTANPSAEAFAIFQDDVEAAAGLKPWCDEQFWPLGAGIVSLFTPRLHCSRIRGWRLLTPGYQRACGAQALVLRRDVLQALLSDPLVMHRLLGRGHNNDAVVAVWAARQGAAIAYHTPSLVGHVGQVSSIYAEGPDRRIMARAVPSVEKIASWSWAPGGSAAIGLVGWDTRTGLGYQNRDLAVHLAVDRWLIPRHPQLPNVGGRIGTLRRDDIQAPLDDQQLKAWLRGLDWIVFIERPHLANLVRVAAHSGVGVACVPNWEWVQPHLDWLAFVDLMICPTRHTLLQMSDWKRRYGFGWEALYVPWPIDTDRFRFQPREKCQRFLYVNGWSGSPIRRLDGSTAPYRRKGLELIVEAARVAPHLSFVVCSQAADELNLPANVEFRTERPENVDLYKVGDVCVQPSHFEGLGLPLLECQAAGMPLVTTDAPPMNEHEPLKTIPVRGSEIVCVGEGPISSQVIDPADLVSVLESLVGSDIRSESLRARQFVVREHSWSSAIERLRDVMRKR